MKTTQQKIIEHKKTKQDAYQDYKNGKIDLFTYGQIVNNTYYSEVKQGIVY